MLPTAPYISCEVVSADFARMPLREQMATTLAADVFAGVHGAGLGHGLWLRPGSSLVELLLPQYVMGLFSNLARWIGANYFSWLHDSPEHRAGACLYIEWPSIAPTFDKAVGLARERRHRSLHHDARASELNAGDGTNQSYWRHVGDVLGRRCEGVPRHAPSRGARAARMTNRIVRTALPSGRGAQNRIWKSR